MTFKSTTVLLYGLSACLIFIVSVSTQRDELEENGILSQESTDVDEDVCGNSQFLTLKERLLENYDSLEELYRLPPFAEASALPKYSRTNDSFYVPNARLECASLQARVNIQGGVACPGRQVENRDVNRVPCVMTEYKCLCRQCLIPHSLQSRRHNNGCEPIYHYVPVMRRTIRLDGEGDQWSYTLEPLAVGCMCASRGNIYSARS